MSRAELRERERRVNMVVLCSLVGLILALAVATVLVYEESSADRPQGAGTSNDRGQLHAGTTRKPPGK